MILHREKRLAVDKRERMHIQRIVKLPDNREQLTLIDTNQRVVSVYHIDPSSGQITLKSVRDVNWDLRMTQFNGTSPLPNEIRTLLQQR